MKDVGDWKKQMEYESNLHAVYRENICKRSPELQLS